MSKPWSEYQQVVVETYYAVKTGKSSRIHVRPVQGSRIHRQWTSSVPGVHGWKMYPVGTKFRIYAKETNREGGKPFLYSHIDWPFEVVQ